MHSAKPGAHHAGGGDRGKVQAKIEKRKAGRSNMGSQDASDEEDDAGTSKADAESMTRAAQQMSLQPGADSRDTTAAAGATEAAAAGVQAAERPAEGMETDGDANKDTAEKIFQMETDGDANKDTAEKIFQMETDGDANKDTAEKIFQMETDGDANKDTAEKIFQMETDGDANKDTAEKIFQMETDGDANKDTAEIDIPNGRDVLEESAGWAHEPGKHLPDPLRPVRKMLDDAYHAREAGLEYSDFVLLHDAADKHEVQILKELRAGQSVPNGAPLLWCASLQAEVAEMQSRMRLKERKEESLEGDSTRAKLLLTGIKRCSYERRRLIKEHLHAVLGGGLGMIDDRPGGERGAGSWLLICASAEAAVGVMEKWRQLTTWEMELSDARLHYGTTYHQWLKETARRSITRAWGTKEAELHLVPLERLQKDGHFSCLRLQRNVATILSAMFWGQSCMELDVYFKVPQAVFRPLAAECVNTMKRALRVTDVLPFKLTFYRVSDDWDIPCLVPLQATRNSSKGDAVRGKSKGAGKTKSAGAKGGSKNKGGKGKALPYMAR
eukprot:CAMPEP_0178457002 /NCGR_PEP_ID=MMETSP0689_2-20121128/46786_1 /TAXON_ID=160604 /ORGANISM="Amphidinium massartii, Strain CS-259" /LENGTH=554 /DNA_ID=CAMNT_0020083227 /DNA_START=112 /DNA_END=1781 /DNA_ORIENTATION=+